MSQEKTIKVKALENLSQKGIKIPAGKEFEMTDELRVQKLVKLKSIKIVGKGKVETPTPDPKVETTPAS